MTDFCNALISLCDRAGITMTDALKKTTRYKYDPVQASLQIKEHDYIPDTKTLHELADYFAVGLDMFFKSKHEADNANKVYLAGPITGVPDFMQKFDDAHTYLEHIGLKVFNPARASGVLPTTEMSRENFIDLGLTLLGMCNAIALMPGYESSTGSMAEKAYAIANRMRVIELTPENMEQGHKLWLDK